MHLLRKRIILIVVVLIISSLYLTFYTAMAYNVALKYVYEDADGNVVGWRYGPAGSFFPWPKEPGMLAIITEINEVDLFIYRYLIKTWILAGFSALMWVATALLIFRVFRACEVGIK